jgi:hypothetical protein
MSYGGFAEPGPPRPNEKSTTDRIARALCHLTGRAWIVRTMDDGAVVTAPRPRRILRVWAVVLNPEDHAALHALLPDGQDDAEGLLILAADEAADGLEALVRKRGAA